MAQWRPPLLLMTCPHACCSVCDDCGAHAQKQRFPIKFEQEGFRNVAFSQLTRCSQKVLSRGTFLTRFLCIKFSFETLNTAWDVYSVCGAYMRLKRAACGTSLTPLLQLTPWKQTPPFLLRVMGKLFKSSDWKWRHSKVTVMKMDHENRLAGRWKI